MSDSTNNVIDITTKSNTKSATKPETKSNDDSTDTLDMEEQLRKYHERKLKRSKERADANAKVAKQYKLDAKRDK